MFGGVNFPFLICWVVIQSPEFKKEVNAIDSPDALDFWVVGLKIKPLKFGKEMNAIDGPDFWVCRSKS